MVGTADITFDGFMPTPCFVLVQKSLWYAAISLKNVEVLELQNTNIINNLAKVMALGGHFL